jgi:hypothetical protein
MLSECLLKIQIKNTIRDDSIQSEKGSTDHEKGLRNLVREIRKSMGILREIKQKTMSMLQ